MKKSLKNYVKLGILLFGISLILVNCENDRIEDRQEFDKKPKFTVKKITHKQVVSNKKIETKISKYKNLTQKVKIDKTQERLLHSDTYGFTIDTDNVNYLERTDGYHSYNFYLIRDNPVDDKLENLVLSLNENGGYDTFILKYEFSIEEYNLLDQNTLPTYTTQITPIDFDTSVFNTSELAKILLYVCAEVWVWGVIDGGTEGQLVGAGNVEEATHGWIFDGYDCNWISGGGGGGEDSGNNDTDNTENTGSGTNSENNNGSISSAPNKGSELSDSETPCKNLKDSITFNPQIKLMFKELKTHANTLSSIEKGFKIRKNPANNQYYPSIMASGSVANDGNYHVKIIASSATVAIVHSHPKGPWEMFSPEDILKMADMAMVTNNNNNINPLNLTFFLVVYNSNSYTTETFALRFDDSQSIQNLIAIKSNVIKREYFIADLNKKYEKSQKQYGGTKPPITDQLGIIYDFLAKNNLNMTIYKAKYSGELIDEWEKINTDLTKEPCN